MGLEMRERKEARGEVQRPVGWLGAALGTAIVVLASHFGLDVDATTGEQLGAALALLVGFVMSALSRTKEPK